MGIPGKPYSLSGVFTPFGKLLMVLTFFMGKNRAMPKLSDHVIHFYFPDLEDALVPTVAPPC
jgi:Trk-type K+ transport system membrane component